MTPQVTQAKARNIFVEGLRNAHAVESQEIRSRSLKAPEPHQHEGPRS